ncbi:MAG TPA: helix-turn-helix domain-containing protein [Cyclobacteriaceae bacterium]|nr:helix-turn-helix domain-containing protein [Cyclobacteriaceae bacterium]
MKFQRIEPSESAKNAVECYWIVEDDDVSPVKQKIIPDGFTEIIFHFGDHYRVNLSKKWQRQSKSLFAGQISGYFHLENTGTTDIVGIKLRPSAVAHLFRVSMKPFTDRVVDLRKAVGTKMRSVETAMRKLDDNEKRVELIEAFISEKSVAYPKDHPVDKALEMIFNKKGMIQVSDICKELSVTDRYIQQLFQKYVGLSPKFFARIIRFSHIFQLIKENNPDWAAVVYEAGYYDQSHFIRNFKAFTGEDPTAYIFAEKSLANFFMKKSR